MVRLAQQASARVIAVDEFPQEKPDQSVNPVIVSEEMEPANPGQGE